MQNVEREQIHTHTHARTLMCKFVHGCCCLFNYLHIFCMASVFACFRYIFLLLLARVFTRVCIIFHLSESLYVCVCVLWLSVFMCFVYIFVVGSFWQKKYKNLAVRIADYVTASLLPLPHLQTHSAINSPRQRCPRLALCCAARRAASKF